jgi:hypothetical protein
MNLPSRTGALQRLADLFGPRRNQQTHRRRPSSRLALECLEDRCVPSVVTTNIDNVPGSLRAAITAAQPGEVISFAASLANQTIVLQSSLPALATNLTITAAGVPNVTVSGAGAFQVFDVNPNVQATIDSLRITGGLNTLSVLSTGGGGITVNPTATLTLTNCIVTGNAASANFLSTVGGGILNEGTLNATNCFITNNSANLNLGGSSAGGIANDGILSLTGCVISGNQAIDNQGSLVAGGIINSSSGVLYLTNCNVTNNLTTASTALTNIAGGVATSGSASVTGCYFAGNSIQDDSTGSSFGTTARAGGLSSSATLTIANSTFASNQASGSVSTTLVAGGISENGVLQLVNCTVTSNGVFTSSASSACGGGIAVSGALTLTNCTVANNTATDTTSLSALGGGIGIAGPLTLQNSIVADNSFYGTAEGTPGPDVSSGNTSLGITANNSLIGTPQGAGYNITSGSGNLTNTEPLLDPAGLSLTGGRLPTLALLAGSPAIDAGSNGFVTNATFPPPPFTDERGTGFSRIINGGSSLTVDMGAFEYHPAPTVTRLSPTSGPEAGGTSVTITGTGFTDATAVKFGTTAATSFTVNSDTSITVTSPAGVGVVDVTVTTPGGTSAAAPVDKFTYIAPLAISNLTVTAWTKGKAGFTGTMTISGGVPPHAIFGTPTGVPTGLKLQLSGTTLRFTGTPTAAGVFHGSVTIKDSAGVTATKKFTITINPALAFTPATLASYIPGKAYSQTITTAGGTGTRTVSYTLSGPLPAGLHISPPSPTTGAITIYGTSSAATSVTITLTAIDSLGAQTTIIYKLTPLVIHRGFR